MGGLLLPQSLVAQGACADIDLGVGSCRGGAAAAAAAAPERRRAQSGVSSPVGLVVVVVGVVVAAAAEAAFGEDGRVSWSGWPSRQADASPPRRGRLLRG